MLWGSLWYVPGLERCTQKFDGFGITGDNRFNGCVNSDWMGDGYGFSCDNRSLVIRFRCPEQGGAKLFLPVYQHVHQGSKTAVPRQKGIVNNDQRLGGANNPSPAHCYIQRWMRVIRIPFKYWNTIDRSQFENLRCVIIYYRLISAHWNEGCPVFHVVREKGSQNAQSFLVHQK